MALISVVGLLARYYIGKRLIEWVDGAMMQVPFVNKFYGAIKQVNEAFSGNKHSFKTVVMVEFPSAGIYSIGFITNEQNGEVQQKTKEKVLCIFVPTTPNPTSGFLILVPEEKVTKLDMTVADGIKYIVSLGSISPEHLRTKNQMIESATGLILRTRPLTETSLIIHWLTPELGRIATVAKGARRAKSPFAGKLDLFYKADFSFSRNRRSDLHNLREVSVREMHGAIRQELFKLQQAAYATAFVEQATETETPLPAVYKILNEFLGLLCREKNTPQIVLALELKLLHELGLEPNLTDTNLTAGTKKIAGILTQDDWARGLRLKLTEAQLAELRQFLLGFLFIHLGRLPKGRVTALADAL